MKLSILSCLVFLSQIAFADTTLNKLSPAEALQKLIDGNNRYAHDLLLHADTSAERREAISSKQEPFAVILGCSDSRVPPEIIFDQGVGDLFIVRVAGNVAGPIELDSMEYAIKHLHSCLIVVLGHENCGAVQATMSGQLSDIDQIATLIKPSLCDCKDINQCVKNNVQHIVEQIKQSSLIAPHLQEKEIDVVGAYYDLNSGKVQILP